MQNLPKVVIIGAGPSGLTSIRHLKNHAQIFCLEGNRSLGGQWLPIQGNKVDHIENQKNNNAYKKYYNSHQSSLYEGLQTNIPHQLMTYKGFSHKKEVKNRESGFLKAEEYLEYLENYSKHFGLHEFMQFNTFVKKVSLVKNLDENCKKQYNITEKNKEKFLVETCQTNDPENQSLFKHFLADHVIVCNGHCIEPSLPEYKNQDTFQGKIIHSHYLLDNSQYEQFSDKVVAIQGVRASGLDIQSLSIRAKNKFNRSSSRQNNFFI
ncbi:hypothetical protein PPERSA_07778 [Pseudocohnilembus persalinus]|uniref:Flavin-containing monooxygenase n=1 Tax=Pseudocohnilembus persalinus TaxID=266149 RepID=A0A0V0RAF9_PSEPJ|nr:hypothetical protein PPERSA_07778 [Pseudocohnilembus persalinus]|eukprot:KRX11253.1 hypothetical protein PPERSA_07778 [Pseudocohnilembus persalinus]